MGLLFSALPFEFALRKVTIISDKATEGNDFTLVRLKEELKVKTLAH